MGRQRQAECGSSRWWGRRKNALRAARKRRISSQRHSAIERLEPRVVLNGAPVAVADPWYTTPQNTTLTVTPQGTTLVANDWDPEGSAISASLVSGPSHGSVSNFQTNGTFSYTPTSGYRGFDSFTYRVSDGSAHSNTVEALIAVGGYLGPRTNQDGAPQDLSLLDGSLARVEPLTPGVTLTYQSNTQANAIVAVDTKLLGGSIPSAISAQLNPGAKEPRFSDMLEETLPKIALWEIKHSEYWVEANDALFDVGQYARRWVDDNPLPAIGIGAGVVAGAIIGGPWIVDRVNTVLPDLGLSPIDTIETGTIWFPLERFVPHLRVGVQATWRPLPAKGPSELRFIIEWTW